MIRALPALLTGALLLLLLLPAGALAARDQEATFQDDDLLVFASPEKVAATLDELDGLGVDRLRISLVWRSIARGAREDRKPEGFDATDPGAYEPGAWDNWDTVLRLARERGMDVNFNVTTPAPDWATGTPGREDIDETFDPDPVEFGRFVRAAATRYDGQHGQPRVSYWSIQNEPNQPGWLTPQWSRRDGRFIEAAPRIYRGMLREAWTALQQTGHGQDTILIGETAPKGVSVRGETRAIAPLRFIRRLYCLDDFNQLLRGERAEAHGCPAGGDQVGAFQRANPGLFDATGYAHHPYELLFAPNTPPRSREWATVGNLEDLQDLLRRVFLRYANARAGRVPLFLTEFGYQTRPPDRLGVTPAQQAAYLNHAEYIAWRNGGVRTLAQFLLLDDEPPVERTFQSGLKTLGGRRKPAYGAYRRPIHVVDRRLRRGQALTVWGLDRTVADGSRPRAQVQFRRRGSSRWRTVATARGDAGKGYVLRRLRAPGIGAVRLLWSGRASRPVTVAVAPRRD